MKTLLPLLVLLGAQLLHAADGGVHGRVYGQDARGENLGPVAHAQIVLNSDSGAATATVTTNEYGYYQIATLAAGAYRYKVTASGFRDEDQKRGFAMPQDTREFVHDFLLTQTPKPGSPPPQANRVMPAVHGRVYGQSEKGENLGPLPGARVELLAGKGGRVVAAAQASTPGGYYEIKHLPPADYAYRVTAEGFAPEDAGRGFAVPQGSIEYVHDFILSKKPPRRERCDLAVLVVKRISNGDVSNDARLPVRDARLVLQPSGKLPTPLNQPFVTDASGQYNVKDLAEGSYTVAIDAPGCEPFTGALAVKCDKDGDVIFELRPCNEILHSYVREVLTAGWGGSPQARTALDHAGRLALKTDGRDCGASYAIALAQLSAGDYASAQQELATAIGKKSDSPVWDRACEARLWMDLCLHQPEEAMREIRSLAHNHYSTRTPTPAAKDTAHVCGIALGLLKGPWHDQVKTGETALLESELLTEFKTELQAECMRARDHVAAEFGRLKAAEGAAHKTLMNGVMEKRNAEIARMVERQTAISQEVAALDPDIQALQATVGQFQQQYRVQVAGFMQQQQANAAQLQMLNARMQQISACMMQDQARMQQVNEQRQMPSTTGMRPGMMQRPEAGSQAVMMEIRQHEVEIQQIRQQMQVIQNQNVLLGTSIVNQQTQFNRSAGAAQADLNIKLGRREVLTREYDALDQRRTAPFDPTAYSTPEIDDLIRRQHALKTYRDLPLELRREELLGQYKCGAEREPKPAAIATQGGGIREEPYIISRHPAAASAPQPTVMRAQPAMESQGGAPPQPPPTATAAARPPARSGDPADIVVTNNHTATVRVFSLSPGSDNELFVRSLEPGEEAMLPARIDQTLIIRTTSGARELQRHKVAKKLEVLKVGEAPQ